MTLSKFLYINSIINGANFSASEFEEIIENQKSDKEKLRLIRRSKLEILEALNQCIASNIACNILGAFSVEKIRELHFVLYKNIDNATAGRFRSYNNKYGGTTDVSSIETELADFCSKLNNRTREDSLAETLAIINFEFIKISPFSTGNKQIARFLCLPFLNEQNDFLSSKNIQDYIWVCKNPTYNGFLKLFQNLESNNNSIIRDQSAALEIDVIANKKASIVEADEPSLSEPKLATECTNDKINPIKTRCMHIQKVKFLPKRKPRQFLRMGAAAACANVPITSLRYWISCGLIDVIMTETNQALFSKEAIDQVKKILRFQQKGYSLKDIQNLIRTKKK